MSKKLDFDPGAPNVMENPFPVYAERRDNCPLGHVAGGPVPYYVVFRYDDVRDVQTDVTRFSSRHGSNPSFRTPQTILNDGDEHLAFRRLFQPRFLPHRLAGYEPAITDIANALIDTMLAGGKTAELYEAYATPLPVKVIAMVLGIADEDYTALKRLADELIELSWTPNPAAYGPCYKALCDILDRHIEMRLDLLTQRGITAPAEEHVGAILPDDSISDMICARPDGIRYLSRPEMHYILMSLFLGGNETTTFLITNCIWRLLEHRDRWERLCADPEKLIPIVIEESLRHDPPNLGLWRTTACPVTLHAREIPANTKIQMSYASANRDPTVFTDPDSFRMDRTAAELRKHMSFGAGPHACVGQYLSRMEMAVTLSLFIKRLPGLRLNGPTERLANFGFWGRRRLPVAWN